MTKKRYSYKTLYRLWQTRQQCFGWSPASAIMHFDIFKLVAGYLPLKDSEA